MVGGGLGLIHKGLKGALRGKRLARGFKLSLGCFVRVSSFVCCECEGLRI